MKFTYKDFDGDYLQACSAARAANDKLQEWFDNMELFTREEFEYAVQKVGRVDD